MQLPACGGGLVRVVWILVVIASWYVISALWVWSCRRLALILD